ncbi:MAG: heavy-metal-associated domain-containing protein [Chlorobi bacterium]|nr:heavy-metal-associated domain-containing protein [Chlorobiota bacterium]
MKAFKYMTLSIFFILAANAFAQSNKIVVRVDGLSCPFCSYALEKKFSGVGSLEKFDVDYKNATITLNLKKGEKLTDEFIIEKVDEAGFTVNKIIRNEKTSENKKSNEKKKDGSKNDSQ